MIQKVAMVLAAACLLPALGTATTTTIADCEATHVVGTDLAQCQGVVGTPSTIAAAAILQGGAVSGIPFYNPAYSIFALAASGNYVVPANTTASASAGGTMAMTVTGGSGSGFLFPCLGGDTSLQSGASSAGLGISFGPNLLNTSTGGACVVGSAAIPFTFGVEQIVGFSFSLNASQGGQVYAFLDGSRFLVNNASSQVVADAEVHLVAIPEPSSMLMLSAGAIVMALARRRCLIS